MKAPLNTTRYAKENPEVMLLEAMLFPGGMDIERQEAEGQLDFVESDTLPTEIAEKDKGFLEESGVEFLGVVPGDDLFQFVKLPDGWKRVPTDHSMWSNLVDGDGKIVAGIFYKAAFYDRRASLYIRVEE